MPGQRQQATYRWYIKPPVALQVCWPRQCHAASIPSVVFLYKKDSQVGVTPAQVPPPAALAVHVRICCMWCLTCSRVCGVPVGILQVAEAAGRLWLQRWLLRLDSGMVAPRAWAACTQQGTNKKSRAPTAPRQPHSTWLCKPTRTASSPVVHVLAAQQHLRNKRGKLTNTSTCC